MLNELKKRMKVIKTCNLYFSLFTLGLSISLTGPCLLDLQHMVHTDTRHIAMVYTARSTGYLAGAILSGILLDYVKYKQAVLTTCNTVVMATMFAIPWCRSVEILMGFMVVNGLSLGAIETGGNVICIQLWGKKSDPLFQGMHFAFGLGGLISPVIAAPFLDNFKDLSPSNNNATSLGDPFPSPTANFSNVFINDSEALPRIPGITYPFSIVGAVGVLVVVMHFMVCIISPTESEGSQDEEANNSDRSFCFMFVVIIFIFMIFFVSVGAEIAYAQTLTTYAVKGKLHVTKTTGSYMTSAFWAAFTISRLVCTFLAIKVRSLIMVICDICIISVSALMLLFLMPREWVLWVASVVFGMGIASSYPALVGWINTRIDITTKISATLTVGCAAGEMVMPFIVAYFIETVPEMFAFVVAAACIIVTVLIFILHCIMKTGKKTKGPKTLECYVIDIDTKEKMNVQHRKM